MATCTSCFLENVLLKPPVLYCSGANCSLWSNRLRRSSYYYVGGKNRYHWCQQCFGELKDQDKIQLSKRKNDEVHDEPWVQCDTCEVWVHQICGLFNTRQNKDQSSKYECPNCTIERRKKTGDLKPKSSTPGAEELPRTILSEYLEDHTRVELEQKLEVLIHEKMDTAGISYDRAKETVSDCGAITIRQVTSIDRKVQVGERMKKRYKSKNCPEEFKCILVFQKIDGVDVMLFAMYVYEHDDKNPAPNSRRLYVSYLDSVNHMRLKMIRSFIYHEILISYLNYARHCSYDTAHIWACPPTKGEDYLIYAKPEDQKIPTEQQLKQWYVNMLDTCLERCIVNLVTNMYDLYFTNTTYDATDVPYFEGNFWVGEAENIIKSIEDGDTAKKRRKEDQSMDNSQKKNAVGRAGTRSNGMSADSGCDSSSKTFEEGARDTVMIKFGETIESMKESFIVAVLNRATIKTLTEVQEELQIKAPVSANAARNHELRKRTNTDGGKGQADGGGIGKDTKPTKEGGRKRDREGAAKGKPLDEDDANNDELSKTKHGFVNKHVPVAVVIDDDKEEIRCDLFNDRRSFLNFGETSKYQCYDLRRAKHTSMMILWHLHNAGAPMFVHQCAECSENEY